MTRAAGLWASEGDDQPADNHLRVSAGSRGPPVECIKVKNGTTV
jgi:hypothetical protein